MFELKNKVIVITGSNGLLGRGIFDYLTQQGAHAVGTDIHFNKIQQNEYKMDITNQASVQTTVDDIVKKYGKIDGWVNNAYPRTADWGNKLEDVPFESWRQNVDMHLNGYFLCSRIILEQMKNQGFGSLINMSSIYGFLAPDFSIYKGTEMTMPVAYSAIKGAITNLTKYFAAYYGPSQVRVNAISPGGVFNDQPEAFVEKYISRVPLARMATPNDIIAVVHFLLADGSAYMTGQNLVTDGGWSIV